MSLAEDLSKDIKKQYYSLMKQAKRLQEEKQVRDEANRGFIGVGFSSTRPFISLNKPQDSGDDLISSLKQEAARLMAMQYGDDPLKGGSNFKSNISIGTPSRDEVEMESNRQEAWAKFHKLNSDISEDPRIQPGQGFGQSGRVAKLGGIAPSAFEGREASVAEGQREFSGYGNVLKLGLSDSLSRTKKFKGYKSPLGHLNPDRYPGDRNRILSDVNRDMPGILGLGNREEEEY